MKPTEKDRKADILTYVKDQDEEMKALRAALKDAELALEAKDVDVKSDGNEGVKEDAEGDAYVEKEYVEIRPDRYVKVVSLCPNPLTLSTAVTGGKTFKFRKIGESKRIIYQDLVDIMEVQPTFMEAGIFYIADKAVIRRHGLDEFYRGIITKEEMETVLAGDDDTAFAIFKSANPRQQKYLVGMLVKRISSGEEIDRNFIYLVSQETGVNIEKEAADEKSFKEILDGKDEK